MLFCALIANVCGQRTCDRPVAGSGWNISRITLDRVRRCRNRTWFCNSVVTKDDYVLFESSHGKEQQKNLFLSQVNEPEKSETRSLVMGIAGQQIQDGLSVSVAGFSLFTSPEDGQSSGITGQQKEYSKLFNRTDGSVSYTLNPKSLVNGVLKTGLFPKVDTFVGLIFDARFNYEYSNERKNKIETGYYNYIVSKLGPKTETIYLAGHSRGGCLAMRLSARFAQAYPKVRMVVHNFDGVCTPEDFTPGSKSEFGVDDPSKTVANPERPGFKVLVTNITDQYPADVGCVAVRSFLSGSPVILESVRGFGHKGFASAQDSLATPARFNWYTQSFHEDDHSSIDNRHQDTAVSHVRQSFILLPCDCGVPAPLPTPTPTRARTPSAPTLPPAQTSESDSLHCS